MAMVHEDYVFALLVLLLFSGVVVVVAVSNGLGRSKSRFFSLSLLIVDCCLQKRKS